MRPLGLILLLCLILNTNSLASTVGVTGAEVVVNNNRNITQNNGVGFLTITLIQAGLAQVINLPPGLQQTFILALGDSLRVVQENRAESGLTPQDEGIADSAYGVSVLYFNGSCGAQPQGCIDTADYRFYAATSATGSVSEGRASTFGQGFLLGTPNVVEQVISDTQNGDRRNGAPLGTFGAFNEYTIVAEHDLTTDEITNLPSGRNSALNGSFSAYAEASQSTAFATAEFGFQLGTPTPVPLPAAAWLFGSALLGLIGYSRRKANA